MPSTRRRRRHRNLRPLIGWALVGVWAVATVFLVLALLPGALA